MQIFNRYEYNPQTDIAGKGEFSRVYKAVDTTNHETIALKIYKVNDLSDHYRSIQEAEHIKVIVHPGLCAYFDIQEQEKEDSFGEKEKLQVCITSFMNAGNIVSYYNSHKDPALLKKLLQNILEGLSCLHKNGIIHGYIKPSNILVTEINGEPIAKITDYAMGIFTEGTPSANTTHPLLSVVSYLSPEQLNKQKYGMDGKISFNSDLWSLGVVIYEALTGEPLFKISKNDFEEPIISRIAGFQLPEAINTLPGSFAAFLNACLIKDANKRIETAEELLDILSQSDNKKDNILQLEEKQALLLSSAELAELAFPETPESTDETRIIALPKKEANADDTKIITKPLSNKQPVANPLSKDMDEDATRIIARPASSTDDDTKIISTPISDQSTANNTAIKDIDEDATRIIAKPAAASLDDDTKIISTSNDKPTLSNPVIKDIDQDATRLISKSGHLPPAKDDTIDQTIIISSVNKENKPVTSANDAGMNAEGEEKKPDIILRRREKPVVLFNRYEYFPATDLIGKGGFSRVYKSFDKKLSRWVALKIYKTGEFSDRYSPIAEIKRVVNLDHPNICRYLDIEEIENENPFGENEKIQVCVMELLDSGNFADYYKANKNPETLKKLIHDILNGLSYLHKNGIIHRDIKPGNILIKKTIEGPVAKITDFGISKNSDTENNSSSALIVSIPYMAPEQLNAKKYGINENISFNLDLWSLGVTIFEVVTGKALFKNSDQDNSEQIMANIMAPELPAKLNDLPEPFKTIVSHCVIKNARERAARAEELMVLLHTTSMPADTTTVLASQAANIISNAEKNTLLTTSAETISPKIEPITEAPVFSVEHNNSTSRFSFGDEEEKPVEKKEKKQINYLAIFLAAAILIFIVFVIYIKTGKQTPVVSEDTNTQKTDTTHKALPVVTVPDTAKKNTAIINPKADSSTKPVAVNKPVHEPEKKKEKPGEETRKKEPAQTEKANSNTAAKYVLILYSEQACTLKINSIDYGDLQNGKPLRIYLVTGKYILQFTSSNNSTSTYTANIEVKPENLGHASKFTVPLK